MSRMKYRVWCKNKQKYEKNPCFLTTDGKLYQYGHCGGMLRLKDDTHIVEECTDIPDKNGKIIYVGDIVKCPKEIWCARQIQLDKLFGNEPDEPYEDFYETITYDYESLSFREDDYPNNWEIVSNIHDGEMSK